MQTIILHMFGNLVGCETLAAGRNSFRFSVKDRIELTSYVVPVALLAVAHIGDEYI
jgi:hypothetical protein